MRAVQPRRRGLSTGIALTALLVGTTSGAFAQDVDDEPFVACSVDDDVAFLGDTVTCDANGLEPEEEFDWELEYFDLDLDIGEVDDPDELSEDEFADFLGESLGTDGATGTADGDGIGSFGFVVPEDLPIEFLAVFEGLVTQGEEYEEYFGGVILGDFELSDLVCSPEPAIPGARVTCEADDQPGAYFDWVVELLDVDDLAAFEDALADMDDADLEDVDLDGLLAELEALGEFDLEGDLEAPFAEGEGTVGDNGVLSYGFDLPADTTAAAYLTVSVSESGFGVYLGEIGEPIEDSSGEGSPVAAPVEKDPTSAPVTVPRPTRVDTGAGGTADGGAGVAGGLWLASGLVALFGAGLARRRRSTV
jgi:hypothetical protein